MSIKWFSIKKSPPFHIKWVPLPADPDLFKQLRAVFSKCTGQKLSRYKVYLPQKTTSLSAFNSSSCVGPKCMSKN